MFAVFETGGKQYKVSVNDKVYVEKLEVEENQVFEFKNVISVFDEKLEVGDPYLKDVTISAVALKQGRAKKILVFHYIPKKKFRKAQGHRQPYTKFQITAINTK